MNIAAKSTIIVEDQSARQRDEITSYLNSSPVIWDPPLSITDFPMIRCKTFGNKSFQLFENQLKFKLILKQTLKIWNLCLDDESYRSRLQRVLKAVPRKMN